MTSSPLSIYPQENARKEYCFVLRVVDLEMEWNYVPFLGASCGCIDEQYSERREGTRDSHFDEESRNSHFDHQMPHSPAAVLEGVMQWYNDMVSSSFRYASV